MLKYKIGEASKVLGMTNDTLRYYESKGIIAPQRDEESGYRYYDSWDINFLLDSMWFRSYGFSILDITSMINVDDLDTYIERCHQQEINLQETINDYQQKLRYLIEYSKGLKEIKKSLGEFKIVESPALLFQERISICQGDEIDSASENLISNWTKLIPQVSHTFIASLDKTEEEILLHKLSWGFSLPVEVALDQQLDQNPKVEFIPNLKCVHTVFYANEKGTFQDCFLNQVVFPIIEQGYNIIKSPIGRQLASVHKDDRQTRYFETWIPIEEK